MPKNSSEEKPVRLYFKSYLQIVRNSVGSNMFRTFYAKTTDQGEFDAFGDGENSCAFYVSAILVIFHKLKDFHGLVSGVITDMEESGWQKVSEPQPGDVIVWEPLQFPDGFKEHIGFYLGNNRAVSTSNKTESVVEHDLHFGDTKRKITGIYRFKDWENDPSAS